MAKAGRTYSLRMLVPPPVPVTHPKVQNLRHSSGMRLAGCWGSVDWIRWSLLSDGILEDFAVESAMLYEGIVFVDHPIGKLGCTQ